MLIYVQVIGNMQELIMLVFCTWTKLDYVGFLYKLLVICRLCWFMLVMLIYVGYVDYVGCSCSYDTYRLKIENYRLC
jgi:hypothetical protein